MKKAIRIRTVSKWHLLKQLNDYLGKRKVSEEVMRKIKVKEDTDEILTRSRRGKLRS